MNNHVDEDFDAFLEEFGHPTERHEAPEKALKDFRGRLPDRLLSYWQAVGFSSFANGLLFLTNPQEFETELEEWIGDTPIVEEDAYHVIARSGFGDLYLWGERSGFRYKIQAARGWVVMQETRLADPDFAVQCFFGARMKKHVDMLGEDGCRLFADALKMHGAPGQDEVFAFEPSLILGGKAVVQNIVKRNVHVHLALLAQMGHREFLDRDALAKKAFG